MNPTTISEKEQTLPLETPFTSKSLLPVIQEGTKPHTTKKGKELIIPTDADTNESAEEILTR